MSSLLRSIAEKWKNSAELCAMIPFDRVFTGRLPSTEIYKFPYVSVLATGGGMWHRSDKSRITYGPLSFSIWVDDAALEFGERVAEEITNVFADRCWSLGNGASVYDMLDEGEPIAHQTDLPNVKAWEVVKLFTACIERERVDRSICCEEMSDAPASETASSAPENGSQGSGN